jgi:predicted RNase H-like nuclease (RuvC/YqgF family)
MSETIRRMREEVENPPEIRPRMRDEAKNESEQMACRAELAAAKIELTALRREADDCRSRALKWEAEAAGFRIEATQSKGLLQAHCAELRDENENLRIQLQVCSQYLIWK